MEKKNYIQLLDRFLKGESTDAEEKILFRWFGSEDATKEIYVSYDEKWLNASDQLPVGIQDKMFRRIENETNQFRLIPARKNRINPLFRYIAVACLFLIMGVSLSLFVGKKYLKTDFVVSTEQGMKSSIELPDGTRVWLNSGSTLKYGNTYNLWNRTVSLNGEGYFEVKRNEDKDFVVQVNGVSVTALGTKFDVKAYDNDVTTTLLEGSVSVQYDDEVVVLAPNQQVEFNNRAKLLSEVKDCDALRYVLWKNNELYFDCESLEKISETLEQLYSVNVVFTSESAKKYTFCGAISNTNLANVLECISMTAPVRYELKNNIVYFSEINQ